MIRESGAAQIMTPIRVVKAGTEELVNLFEADGTPKCNPVLTDSDGRYEFYVEDGNYDLI